MGFGTGNRPDLLVQSTADVGPGEYSIPGSTGERQVCSLWVGYIVQTFSLSNVQHICLYAYRDEGLRLYGRGGLHLFARCNRSTHLRRTASICPESFAGGVCVIAHLLKTLRRHTRSFT